MKSPAVINQIKDLRDTRELCCECILTCGMAYRHWTPKGETMD
jgi:hypothetical protein